jgi:hypothetical protein
MGIILADAPIGSYGRSATHRFRHGGLGHGHEFEKTPLIAITRIATITRATSSPTIQRVLSDILPSVDRRATS